MDLQIVAFGIEEVSRSPRLSHVFFVHDLHAGLFQVGDGGDKILFGQFEREMGSAVVEIAPIDGLGSLE